MTIDERRSLLARWSSVAGVASVVALGGVWMRSESRAITTLQRQAEARTAPLRHEKTTLQAAGVPPYRPRPLLQTYADALAYLDTALEALDLEGGPELVKGGMTGLAKSFRASDWPEIASVDLTVTLSYWTYPAVVTLLSRFFQRFPATLARLTLSERQSSVVLTLYGEGAAAPRDDGSGGAARDRRGARSG
jgi:hypothetical protein